MLEESKNGQRIDEEILRDEIELAALESLEKEKREELSHLKDEKAELEHHKDKVRIKVNGTSEHVKKGYISYNEVVTFAFPDFPQHPERSYSVKYKNGPAEKPEGILPPGGKVEVRENMDFNVKYTGQS